MLCSLKMSISHMKKTVNRKSAWENNWKERDNICIALSSANGNVLKSNLNFKSGVRENSWFAFVSGMSCVGNFYYNFLCRTSTPIQYVWMNTNDTSVVGTAQLNNFFFHIHGALCTLYKQQLGIAIECSGELENDFLTFSIV